MKKYFILFFMIFCSMAAIAYGADFEVIRSATITVGGTFVMNEPTTGLPLIDDFNDNGRYNNVGGLTGGFDQGNADITVSNALITAGNYAAKIEYDVKNDTSFVGYYSKLEALSFTPYGSLAFDVRGANGGEYFKIQLQTNSGTLTESSIMVTDAVGRTATTSWQTVTIPLLSFFNLANLSSMKELILVFEGAQMTANGSSLSGTIYIDNIRVVGSGTPNTLLVDNFNDRVGTCSLGGNTADPAADGSSASHSFSGSEMISSCSLVGDGAWGGQTMMFGGGVDGWQPVTRDELMQYNGMSVVSRIVSGTPRVKIELEVHSHYLGANTRMFYYFDGTSATVDFDDFMLATFLGNFPMSDFGGFTNAVDTIFGKCSIIYERATGYTDTGSIAIDEIKFTK